MQVVVQDDENGKKKLAFIYPEGPVLPKPDREVVEASRKKRAPREEPEVRRAKQRATNEPPESDIKPPPEPLKS